MSHKSFGVLGTGALGGLYGGLLARQGTEVHFLLRSDFEHVRDQGLRVDSPLGDFHLSSPLAYASHKDMPKVDVAVVAWKTTNNDQLATALQSVCHPQTIVLVLQNGLEVEQIAADAVGADRVLGGCCFLCSNKIAPGHIHHLDYGAILFGEYDNQFRGQVTDRMRKLTEIFVAAGIEMNPTEDLMRARWKKLVWNIPFNGLSVVLQANTQQIMGDPRTEKLAADLMKEVVLSARSADIIIEEEHIENMLQATRRMVPYDSSMYLDFKARRPIEVESIFGNPLRSAFKNGYHPRKIEMLYEQLCFVDQQNRRMSG